ncbi:MAG: tetratricopeptide repeat protein [Blastocatellia bacterium]
MNKRLPLLIAVLAIAGWSGNFIIKNFVASALIAYGQSSESRDLALSYAPSNAEALAARARFLFSQSGLPRADEAIADLRRAVEVSPNDYRYWLELGKAYAANDQTPEAESAMQRATELAPRYFEPRWALANLRLRAGKNEASLEDFRQAIALSGSLYGNATPPPDRNATLNAYNAIAGAVGMNLNAFRRITPADAAAQAYLAEFLSGHDAMDQAVEIWRRLPADTSASYRNLIAQLTRELQARNRFAEAREVWLKFAAAESFPATDAQNLIPNPGFEVLPLREKLVEVVDLGEGFDWAIRRHPEVRSGRNSSVSHSGSYALLLAFNASMSADFAEVSQLIAVESARRYRLSYFVKTKNISSLPTETPFIEITDAANAAQFSLRSVVPNGTMDWSEQSITFSTPENTRGLRLMIRAPRLKAVDNLRLAELWLDDFKLSQQ